MKEPDTNVSQGVTLQKIAADLNANVKTPLKFVIIEFLLITLCVIAAAVSLLASDYQGSAVIGVTVIAVLILLIVLNRRFLYEYESSFKQEDNQRKAKLYSFLFGSDVADDSINVMRSRAIQYSQELIDDYKTTRRTSRNVYYLFQISTIVLSGVTPILVLLDKVDINISWVKWLPVIFPAIASIVTSLSTSFPFQENWMAANTAVELLEAEQEKFILGVTPAYRFFDLRGDGQRKQKVQESVESFINQVNKIHLRQVQSSNEPEAPTKNQPSSSEPNSEK